MGWNQQEREREQPDDICHTDWFVHCHSKEQRWQANRGNSRIGSCSRRSAAAWGMNVLLDAMLTCFMMFQIYRSNILKWDIPFILPVGRRHLNSFGGFRVLDSWTDTVAFCSGPSIQEKASIQWPVYWYWSLKLSQWTDTYLYIYIPDMICIWIHYIYMIYNIFLSLCYIDNIIMIWWTFIYDMNWFDKIHDTWCLICDIWYELIWYMIYGIWYDTRYHIRYDFWFDIWYMICDIFEIWYYTYYELVWFWCAFYLCSKDLPEPSSGWFLEHADPLLKALGRVVRRGRWKWWDLIMGIVFLPSLDW